MREFLFLLSIVIIYSLFYLIFALKREKTAREARTPVAAKFISSLRLEMSFDEAIAGQNSDIPIEAVNWDNLRLELPNSNKHACLFISEEELLSDGT